VVREALPPRERRPRRHGWVVEATATPRWVASCGSPPPAARPTAPPGRCCGPHNGNWPRGHRALERTRNTEQPATNQTQPDIDAEHWVHLKTSNPIESTFSTVRLRTRVTKGPGSKAAGLAMAFKLLEAAQDRWRVVNGPHLVALVRAGARFDKGVMIERPDDLGEVAA
jgi:hypothetical protein